MSAIAKPNVIFTNAINNKVVVPVEFVHSAEKLNIPAAPNAPASTAEYLILFTMVQVGSATKVIKIRFATSAARDTSFTNYETLVAASVA